jgi:hypothetical protein
MPKRGVLQSSEPIRWELADDDSQPMVLLYCDGRANVIEI